ncbi:FtsX-like permease family protein [Allorhizocola rhizosphaerae]|uniref:FtsX-like permease family protein n=1 Tax=Allorhizocola rhizosphaerae TaxID=1872709 RepID=UPI000E3E8E6C|nr:FtsX-like permease family protein [Allorhizocola rhizosphaerae]
MRPSTLVKLAWAGNRADWLRLVFTACGAAMGTIVLLAAATVHWLPPTELIIELGEGAWSITHTDHRYATSLLNDTAARPVVAAALLLLTLPALAFAGQSARLGAPARDRRLAAIRLAGATPGQIRFVGVAEATVACFVGALLGIGCYLAIRVLAHRPVLADPWAESTGEPPRNLVPRLPLPTDALPPLWTFGAVVVAVTAVAALLSALALRRVTVTPLAVRWRSRQRPLRWWPLVLIAVGFVVLVVHLTIDRQNVGNQRVLLPLTGWTAVLSLIFGVALCAAPLGQLVARLTRRYMRRPGPMLAAKWIIADPWSGTRSLAILLISVFIGAAAIRGITYAEAGLVFGWVTEQDVHRFGLFVLVVTLVVASAGLLFAMVEGMLTRRRALAGLIAAGTPHGTLARAVLMQALLPGVPAVLLAVVVGVAAVASAETQPLPLSAGATELALLGGGAIAGIALAAAVSLIVLRASVAVDELRTE